MAQEFRRRACQSFNRLSKSTFLSMLGDPAPAGEEFSISTSRAFFEKMPAEDWTIASFNPSSREVCVRIINDTGTRNVSIILPVLSVSKS